MTMAKRTGLAWPLAAPYSSDESMVSAGSRRTLTTSSQARGLMTPWSMTQMLESSGGTITGACGDPPAVEDSGQVIPSVYAVMDIDPYA